MQRREWRQASEPLDSGAPVSARPRALLRLTGDAPVLELERSFAQELRSGGELQAHYHGPEGLLLLRERPGVSGVLSGSLSSLSLGELFGLLVGGLRTGRLVVQAAGARKTVVLRDGQAVFASSTERHERLGAVLLRLGLVSAEALRQALAHVGPQARVGQVLVKQGALSANALYSAMTFLVRDILINLFELTEGDFLFQEGGAPPEDALRLPERTRELVLLGIKRGEEVMRLRQRLPGHLRLVPGPVAPTEEAALVAHLTQGPLLAARPSFDDSEHAFLTWVEEQLARGTLSLPGEGPCGTRGAAAGQRAAGEAEPLSAPQRYGALIQATSSALLEAGQDLSQLRTFLTEPQEGMEEVFVGVELGESGALDVARVLENVKSQDAALARAIALEALDAFASYALFAAKNALPREKAAALDARFRQLHQEGG
jgi:hypothetical protein